MIGMRFREICEEEDVVDKMSAQITSYAVKLSSLAVSEKEHQEVTHMLQVLSDIERISDYCENISEFAESLIEAKPSLLMTAKKS